MKSFLVIGCGTFGAHMCRSLSQYKCEIMAADLDDEAFEEVMPYVVSAKIGNCTNIEVLKSFDVEKFDACFVCIGGNFQASLEVTDLLKELGAKRIYSKAETDIQAKFLLRVGADQVIFPEKEMAVRLAAIESSDRIFDYIQLSPEYSVYEISCADSWYEQSIIDLDFRRKYDLNILGIRKSNGDFLANPPAGYVFEKGDHPLVFGRFDSVKRTERLK